MLSFRKGRAGQMVVARRKTSNTKVARLAILLATCLITVPGFLSAFACEFPSLLVTSTGDASRRVIEFRARLQSPDFANISAVKQHLAFTTILARVLIAEVASRSRGQCNIIASTSLFPDIRIALNRITTLDGLDTCSDIIKDILVGFTPSGEAVENIAASIASSKRFSIQHPAGFMTEANNVLNEALKYIYEETSVMHALVSVSPNEFDSISSNSFTLWLQNQRSNGRLELTSLVFCKSDEEVLSIRLSNREMPYSNIILPQTISLSSLSRLHYVVLVGGDFLPENAPLRSAATRKYCGHENTFSSDNSSFVARTRCLTEIVHNTDTWVALFCDPNVCSSAEMAEKVATAIVNDPEVIALGKLNAQNNQIRGPYLIKLIRSTTSRSGGG
jgi:hypothetical protein